MFFTDTVLEYRLEYLTLAGFDKHIGLLSEGTDFDSKGTRLIDQSISEMAGYLFQNLMHLRFQ